MKDFHSILRSIGLLDSETRTYLVSLEAGPATAQILARKTGLSRPATYSAIDGLISKGLMASRRKGKRNQFVAESGARLVAYAESRSRALDANVSELSSAVDDLELLRKGERPTVKFYEGVEGLNAILLDIAQSNPTSTEEISNMDAVRAVLSTSTTQPVKDTLAKRRVKGRALLLGETHKLRPGVEAKALPATEFDFHGDVLVYGSKIAMVTFKDKIVGAVIENEILAETMKALFGLAWKGAAGYPDIGKRDTKKRP